MPWNLSVWASQKQSAVTLVSVNGFDYPCELAFHPQLHFHLHQARHLPGVILQVCLTSHRFLAAAVALASRFHCVDPLCSPGERWFELKDHEATQMGEASGVWLVFLAKNELSGFAGARPA